MAKPTSAVPLSFLFPVTPRLLQQRKKQRIKKETLGHVFSPPSSVPTDRPPSPIYFFHVPICEPDFICFFYEASRVEITAKYVFQLPHPYEVLVTIIAGMKIMHF